MYMAYNNTFIHNASKKASDNIYLYLLILAPGPHFMGLPQHWPTGQENRSKSVVRVQGS